MTLPTLDKVVRWGDEVPAAQWASVRIEIPGRPRARYECDGRCWGVFRCRAPGMRFACGRYVCACNGGSDDNRCSECWCRLERAAPRLIRQLLRASAWRSEVSLCKLIAGEDQNPLVVDALFALVRQKKIEWFGDNQHRGDVPLRYRIARAA